MWHEVSCVHLCALRDSLLYFVLLTDVFDVFAYLLVYLFVVTLDFFFPGQMRELLYRMNNQPRRGEGGLTDFANSFSATWS